MKKSPIYVFGEFRIDAEEETLWCNGERLRINRRTFQVLQLLVENGGKIVSKQKFFETVWADTFVADNSLTVTMTTLRKILGESSREPKFIENISRKGYRFIAPVKEIAETEINGVSPIQVNEGKKQLAAVSESTETSPEIAGADEVYKFIAPVRVSLFENVRRLIFRVKKVSSKK